MKEPSNSPRDLSHALHYEDLLMSGLGLLSYEREA